MEDLRAAIGVHPYDLIPDDLKLILDPDYYTTTTIDQPKLSIIPGCDYWVALPEDIMYYIVSILPLDSLVRCMSVCRRWNRFIRNTSAFWIDLCYTGSRVISQEALEMYLGYACKPGIRKIAIDPRSALYLDGERLMKVMLKHGVSNLQHLGKDDNARAHGLVITPNHWMQILDLTYWRVSTVDVVKLLKDARKSLRYLNLSNMGLAYFVWNKAIQICEVLEHIECLNCRTSLSTLKSLTTQTSLKTLRFSGMFKPDVQLYNIHLFPNLEELTLECLGERSIPNLSDFFLHLPKIRKLKIRIPIRTRIARSSSIPPVYFDMDMLDKVTVNASHLEYLSFSTSAMTSVWDVELQAILDGCFACLTGLELSLTNITDKSMRHIALRTLPSLKILKLSRCSDISVDALILAIEACPQLRQLDISFIPSMSDRLLECLGECKCLEVLNLAMFKNEDPKLSNQGLRSLVVNTKSIRKLCVLGPRCFDQATIAYAYSSLGASNCIFS